MIKQFRDKVELRRFMPERLPVTGPERYLYLVWHSPKTLKVGFTSHVAGRMNDIGWFGDIGPIWLSSPIREARAREKRLVLLGNALTGRRPFNRDETFTFRLQKLNQFTDAFVSLAKPESEAFEVMKTIIGKCSICGGRVTVPHIWMSVEPPSPTCDGCHAVAENTGPVIPMRPIAEKIQRMEKAAA